MYHMVRDSNLPSLGIEGNPPEKAVYLSVLREAGLHRANRRGERWGFFRPDDSAVGASCHKLWEAFERFLHNAEETPGQISELYEAFRGRPFGLRSGIIPILALAFLLAEEDKIALYLDNVFVASVDDLFVDRLLQDPKSVSVRKFEVTGISRSALENVAGLLNGAPQQRLDQLSPLTVAKPLVTFVRSLNPWVRRTRRLSPVAVAVRDALLRADDPYALLFDSLPQACGLEKIESHRQKAEEIRIFVERLSSALGELRNAYDAMLTDLRSTLAGAFGFKDLTYDELPALAARARDVIGKSGDFRLDAFAQRLSTAASDPEWVQSVASLAMNKPSRDWTDPDLDRADLELTDLANRFHRVERLIMQREGSNVSFSLLYRDGAEIVEFERCIRDEAKVEKSVSTAAQEVLKALRHQGLSAELAVSAVARALKEVVGSENSQKNGSARGGKEVFDAPTASEEDGG
jgi:hypothetical protein